jgi:hypothetical protein
VAVVGKPLMKKQRCALPPSTTFPFPFKVRLENTSGRGEFRVMVPEGVMFTIFVPVTIPAGEPDAFASSIAWRNEPAPASFVLVTENVAAKTDEDVPTSAH